MKKAVPYLVVCFAILSMISCEKQNQQYDSGIELEIERKEIAIFHPATSAEIEIMQGNGGYRIIYPKEIFCNYWGERPVDECNVAFSEEFLNVTIDGNKINFELRFPAYKEDGSGHQNYINACFLIADVKGHKRLFVVRTASVNGGLISDAEWEELEMLMIADEEYWQ